jgi:uncharacterized membrane protein YecN with MAPEG domain
MKEDYSYAKFLITTFISIAAFVLLTLSFVLFMLFRNSQSQILGDDTVQEIEMPTETTEN